MLLLLLLLYCVCVQGFLYMRSCKADNEYAHPLDLCPLVDLNLGKVRTRTAAADG
jgi:Cu2+-containing amine oxidase